MEELKTRYRYLIKRYHPDMHPDATDSKKQEYVNISKTINQAYAILIKYISEKNNTNANNQTRINPEWTYYYEYSNKKQNTSSSRKSQNLKDDPGFKGFVNTILVMGIFGLLELLFTSFSGLFTILKILIICIIVYRFLKS